MRLITRDYLNTLVEVLSTPDIKVVTGVRRAGKSILLQQLASHIKKKIPHSHLIHINFNRLEFADLRDHQALHTYVQSHSNPRGRNYLLIDEVQMCDGFEWAINSLHDSGNYKIVLTGSNAFLEKNDLATLFVGRVFPIEVFPFSLREFRRYFPGLPLSDAFALYQQMGGFAGSYEYPSSKQQMDYVRVVFETLVVRDIVDKYRIKDEANLHQIIDFLTDNIGNLTTANKITNVLRRHRPKINHETVGNYLLYLTLAFGFYRVRRYDIKGRMYLASQDKYYLVDHAWRYARLGRRRADYGRVWENMVAIELLRRGYELSVGVIGSKEIDFVAEKNGERMYIQVCADLSHPQTRRRELDSLLDIRDGSPKILLTRSITPVSIEDGVRVLDIAHWLAGETDDHRC